MLEIGPFMFMDCVLEFVLNLRILKQEVSKEHSSILKDLLKQQYITKFTLLLIWSRRWDTGAAIIVQYCNHTHPLPSTTFLLSRVTNSSIFKTIRKMWNIPNKITIEYKILACWIISFSLLFLISREWVMLPPPLVVFNNSIFGKGCLSMYAFNLIHILTFRYVNITNGITAVIIMLNRFIYHKL